MSSSITNSSELLFLESVPLATLSLLLASLDIEEILGVIDFVLLLDFEEVILELSGWCLKLLILPNSPTTSYSNLLFSA